MNNENCKTTDVDKDSLRRFLLENTNVRGEWVHLDNSWQTLLARSSVTYPKALQKCLGEALAAIVLLSATLKYKGALILQIGHRSRDKQNILVVQATSSRTLRGLARWSEGSFDENKSEASLKEIFGAGSHIAITLQPSDNGEPWQGIIDLQEDTMTENLKRYFAQSEQLPTRIWLASDEHSAAGLLLQRMPENSDDKDGWQRAQLLADTLQADELLSLDSTDLLSRLFAEEQVRLYDAEPLSFQCGCSRERIAVIIKNMGQAEAEKILAEQGCIEADCEFCNAHYAFDTTAVKQLFALAASSTQH